MERLAHAEETIASSEARTPCFTTTFGGSEGSLSTLPNGETTGGATSTSESPSV
jgi:hypothetical protein